MIYNNPMTTAAKVAEYLIYKAAEEGKPLTNKRLQKLLYYIQAWHLAINASPLFPDRIEAWIHGPAIRSIYEEYKSYIARPIDRAPNKKVAEELGKEITQFIDRIFSAYSKYDTVILESMTHAEDPWQKARQGLETNQSSNNEITHESMRTYYASRLADVK